MIVYCQAHGGSHFLRYIRRSIPERFTVVMCKASNNFPMDGNVALVRDPRDRLVSQYRFWGKKKPGKIAKLEQKYPDMDDRLYSIMKASEGKSVKLDYFEATQRYIDIIQNADCEIVKFEDLVRGGEHIKQFLGLIGSVGDPKATYESAFGVGRTFTGKFSNHRDWFGPKSNDLWIKNKHLLEALGYE